MELVPICREDLVCLPKVISRQLGDLGPVVLVIKVSNVITFLDPLTLKTGELTP